MVPHLHQVDPVAVPEKRVIQIETLFFSLYLFPVAGIKAQESPGSYEPVHTGKRKPYVVVNDISQRISGARHTVELPAVPAGQVPEVTALKFNGLSLCLRFHSAAVQHRLIQVGPAYQDAQFLQRQSHAAGPDADVQHRADIAAAQESFPVPPDVLSPLVGFDQIVNIRTVIQLCHVRLRISCRLSYQFTASLSA